MNRVRERERRKQRGKSCIEKISGVNPGKEVSGGGGSDPSRFEIKSKLLLPAPEKNEIPSILSTWEMEQKEHSPNEISFLSG